MLPHTGLFLLGKVALQMRICCRLKNMIPAALIAFRRPVLEYAVIACKSPY